MTTGELIITINGLMLDVCYSFTNFACYTFIKNYYMVK